MKSIRKKLVTVLICHNINSESFLTEEKSLAINIG